MGRFDAKHDAELIAAKTHFYCHSHLMAMPVEKQSPENSRYCMACWQILKAAAGKAVEPTPLTPESARGVFKPVLVLDSVPEKNKSTNLLP